MLPPTIIIKLVGARGFEPPTPWSRTKCATRLRYAPIQLPFALLARPEISGLTSDTVRPGVLADEFDEHAPPEFAPLHARVLADALPENLAMKIPNR